MKEEYCKFIEENELSPLNQNKTQLGFSVNSIYKTKDGKAVHNKVLSQISSKFNFADTSNLWQCLGFTTDINEIKRRQNFFRTLDFIDTKCFSELKKPRAVWSPKYEIVAVTEDEETFVKLNELGCGVKFLNSDMDLSDLNNYDIVQVIDCDAFSRALESLPQSVFIDRIEDIYLERYLEILSGWKENLLLLDKSLASGEAKDIISQLLPLFIYLEEKTSRVVKREDVDKILEEINDKIGKKIKDMTISGGSLMKMLGEGKLPEEFQKIINEAIEDSKIPKYIFNIAIPVSVDEKELDALIKRQSSNEFSDLAEEIKSKAELLKSIPAKLQRISNLLIVNDFLSGIYEYAKTATSFPELSKEVYIEHSKNYFLENAQPINFNLTNQSRCSILTGANSGGKTTLLEHFIQLISLFQIGLPINGNFKCPLFSEIYYFAKNKGAANKGAFENLLTQMSEIKPGAQTLILADEIEAVTEPGVAGKIIASTAEYFLNKNCFLVIATHLGYEIKEVLPRGARIDGIEAKGLDKEFNLIVDHNPVIGRLANSTPELIVEKMANIHDKEYFRFLWGKIKG
jgi:DNA mismatch repair protein MutS2